MKHEDIDHTGLTGAGTPQALDTTDSPEFAAVNIGHASDTTLARASAGNLTVGGNALYRAGGTDVPIADGGTGASTKAAAFDALSPMTTSGDIIYGGASGTGTRLAKGTDGEVLTLVSGLPSWETGGGGGSGDVATDTIWNAKGDLAVGTGSDTASRLGVGTDGHVLTADSGEATGLKWAAAAGGGGVTHSYLGYNTVGGSTTAVGAGVVYMKKITLASAGLLLGLDLYLDHTTDTVAGVPSLGIWTDNSNSPLTLIHQSNSPGSDHFYLGSTTSSWPARWIGVGSFGKYLTAADYWIGWMFADAGSLRLYDDGSGSDQTFASGAFWLANGDRYTLTNTGKKFSARVSFLAL